MDGSEPPVTASARHPCPLLTSAGNFTPVPSPHFGTRAYTGIEIEILSFKKTNKPTRSGVFMFFQVCKIASELARFYEVFKESGLDLGIGFVLLLSEC